MRSHVILENTYLLITDLHATQQDLHSKGGTRGASTTERELAAATDPMPLLGPHCPI